jgi:hypothetical protein
MGEKTGTATTKSSVCSVKVLDLLLWCPILVFALSIPCFVRKGAASLVGQVGVKMAGGVLIFSTFLGFMGHPLQVGALKWSHQVTGL